jgi:glucose/arabinose dehydrogenase/azurin/lysophospholipase L1-like esterase
MSLKQTLALAAASFVALSAGAAIPLENGSTLLFYGNSLVERLSEQGEMEAWIQLANPDGDLHFRSLAWTGDEVGNRQRAEGYAEHLKNLIAQWPAKVVVLGFGMNESFAGSQGVDAFKNQLVVLLKQLARQHSGARFVLLGPTAVEAGASPAGVDAGARNLDISLYSKAIADVAKAHQAEFVDLFTETEAAFAQATELLTSNGLHLNTRGNALVSRVIARAFVGDEALGRVDAARFEEVAKAAARKSAYVADVVRLKNGVVYYGVRKRPDEYALEVPRYYQLVEKADTDLHALVQNKEARFSDFSVPTLPPLPAGKSKPDAVLGVVKPAAQQQAEISVAPGFELNLFASDEQFPDLRNPVQMAFDARGRLWVLTMPSWPHTVPGSLPEDKVLILEDTDRDGKADKCTVFVDGLDAVDGIAFHEDGVIVSAQPRLWIMRDTNGDDRADVKTELLRGVDVTDSHHGGMIAADPLGKVWLCDGVFHRSQFETPFGEVRGIDASTYRLDPHSGRMDVEWQSTTPNPWKMTFDREGSPFQMYGDGLVLDGLQLTWTPLGAYHKFAHAKVLGYGKGSGAASISSPNFPDAYQHGMASATLLGRYFVAISKLSAVAGPYSASDRIDVLKSDNPAFRPVDVVFGMDGGMYVSDFSSAIIGHAQHPMRDPLWNHERGRIWRVVSTEKPVVRDWPKIEGQPADLLLELLHHPQDLVRDHARIALRRLGSALIPALDVWVSSRDRTSSDYSQCLLEALWLFESKGETREGLLKEALKSENFAVRCAAVQLIRHQQARLSDPAGLLSGMLADAHPRVRMAVVNVVALLRKDYPHFDHVLHGFQDENPAVTQMLQDLRLGTRPLKGRSVPVLEMAADTQLLCWQSKRPDGEVWEARGGKTPIGGSNGTWVSTVESALAQPVLLSVKHGYVDIVVNGVQLLSTDSMWSSQQQAQFELNKGLNRIEITFRNLKANIPPIYLSNLLGERPDQVRIPSTPALLSELNAGWNASHSSQAGALHVQAVPNQMQFAPKELRVKKGAAVQLVFENPDLMIHNFVLLKPGSEEEVGALADRMARQEDAAKRGYIPKTNKILHASGLLDPGTTEELNFTAPAEPGRYPFICTFPGHWRIMKGVLVVE